MLSLTGKIFLKACFVTSDFSDIAFLNKRVITHFFFPLELPAPHRRTGIFLPGGRGGVNHLPKIFFQVAQFFTKCSVERKQGSYDALTMAYSTGQRDCSVTRAYSARTTRTLHAVSTQ